ncbi:MAG: nitrile hydratase subunit alpha [Gammaproteobacteria bacterium]|nr:nitrile hydratase subunit alpha [Gammaproteobacteria bacterium]
MSDDHHDHSHPLNPDEEHTLGYYGIMEIAVRELLIEQDVISQQDVRAGLEALDKGDAALGARVVARAWTDDAFKSLLLRDGTKAVSEFGVNMGLADLYAVENTPTLHNVVVCTLCSCYPRALLGLPPDWYKSRHYRARIVREPRSVLEEFGLSLSDSVEVRVHDSTADLRYLVLPDRPKGTEHLGEGALADLITRDCMIGTSIPQPASG